ncbi:MAG TPA: hypothetical protein VM689_05970 [Aliidongia sp.]|nr:hypothetical protein [Aliidongia sp.]
MRETLIADDFRPHLGRNFRPAGWPDALVFVSLDAMSQSNWTGPSRQPFFLILRGPRERILPEGEYRFEVEGAEPLDLHIMPIHTLAEGHQDYQIAFN